MRASIGSALLAHLQGPVQTLATLWKVTLLSGSVRGFTSHVADIIFPVYHGVTYAAASGFTPSTIMVSAGLAVDNLVINGTLASPAITEQDLNAGIWDGAGLEIYFVNYNDLTMGAGWLARGLLGQVTIKRNAFAAETRSLSQKAQQATGRLYTTTCPYDLGDSECKVNLTPITVSGTVTGVTSNRIFADTSLGHSDGWFAYGKCSWLTGANAGLEMEVKSYVASGGVVTLELPMPYPIAPGDTYTVYQGCDKTKTGGCTLHSNIINFGGHDEIPGIDKLLAPGGVVLA